MWLFSFLNWWNPFKEIEEANERLSLYESLMSELKNLVSSTDTKFKNFIIAFEDWDTNTLKKIKQKYNEFLELKEKLERWRYLFPNSESWVQTMKDLIKFINQKFWFFFKTLNKTSTNSSDSFSSSTTLTTSTSSSNKKNINYFERPENQELWEYLLKLCDDAWMRWRNWETSFENEAKAFKAAASSLSDYQKFINYMCRDRWYSYKSKEVQHLVKCLDKWVKLIEQYHHFFTSWTDRNLDKAKHIIDQLNEISYELTDDWFYENMLLDYDEKYWMIEDSEWPEPIDPKQERLKIKEKPSKDLISISKDSSWKFVPENSQELIDLIQEYEVDPKEIDVSNIEDFSNMFALCTVKPWIEDWDMSNARNVNSMFYKAKFVNSKVDLSKWNMWNVYEFDSMFNWSNFDWNCNFNLWENVDTISARYMFIESKFTWKNSQHLSNWTKKEEIDTESMFSFCKLDPDFEQNCWLEY